MLIPALRYAIKLLLIAIGTILLILLIAVSPVDHTPPSEQEFYGRMNRLLDALDTVDIPKPTNGIQVGFAKENITPSYPTAMAGSGLRKLHFEGVRDSIYVRAIVFMNGTTSVAVVSLDMLLVPPEVTLLLKSKLNEIGFGLENVYLSATHTHSSIGNWAKRLSGRLYSGPYDQGLVQFVTDKTIQAIHNAKVNALPARLSAGAIPVSNIVYNRVTDEGSVDSLFRVIEMVRTDSSRLVLASFTGHPTCNLSTSVNISRDYPGVFVDGLEHHGYAFAMFVAGAVGSHGCRGPDRGTPLINYVGEALVTALLNHRGTLSPVPDSTLFMVRVPLELGEAQFKISKDWRIRPWLFRLAFGSYPAELAGLRIGGLLLLGAPCDFSGELMPPIDSAANKYGMQAMVTSFDGNYIGYITRDDWYDVDHYETRLMNWYGPGNGSYLTRCMIKLVKILSR